MACVGLPAGRRLIPRRRTLTTTPFQSDISMYKVRTYNKISVKGLDLSLIHI